MRLKAGGVFDLEKDLRCQCVKVVRLENELKDRENLMQIWKPSLTSRTRGSRFRKNALLQDLFQAKSIAIKIHNDNKQTRFYTGLPSFGTFRWKVLGLDYQWLRNYC